MDNLEYSTEALSSKGLFYNKQFTVYVEGKDDKLFWKYLFELANRDVYIEDVGGKDEVEKYIRKIINENAEFIVACDRDYHDFDDNQIIHNNIIKTYGYSIENSMYNINELQSLVQKLSRSDIDVTLMLEAWLDEFSKSIEELIIYDIANFRFNKGESVLPNNCTRLLTNNQSCKISLDKVEQLISNLENSFSEEELNEVKALIERNPKDLWYHIRGHFLTNGAINIVKNLVKRQGEACTSIPIDFLYVSTVDCRRDWENKIDVKTVVDEIKNNCN